MHSLASIVGCVLTRKNTYPRWSRKIKSTFIYNDLWDKICEGKAIQTKLEAEIATDPKPPTLEKEIFI